MSLDKKFLEAQILYEKRIADLEAKLAESEKENKAQLRTIKFLEEALKKPKEIRFNGFVVDCNYDEARKVLQEDILKMQAENKKLKESEELSNYAKCILENKKLEEDLELSEKCCIKYEEEIKEYKKHIRFKGKEITQLKQQLVEKDKKIKSLTLAHFESETNKPVLTTTEIINQCKIELLERLKSMIKADYDNHFPDFPLGIVEKKHIEYIDTLIKEIKGE